MMIDFWRPLGNQQHASLKNARSAYCYKMPVHDPWKTLQNDHQKPFFKKHKSPHSVEEMCRGISLGVWKPGEKREILIWWRTKFSKRNWFWMIFYGSCPNAKKTDAEDYEKNWSFYWIGDDSFPTGTMFGDLPRFCILTMTKGKIFVPKQNLH